MFFHHPTIEISKDLRSELWSRPIPLHGEGWVYRSSSYNPTWLYYNVVCITDFDETLPAGYARQKMHFSFLKMSECQTKAGNQAYSLTLLLSHYLTQSLSTCWTTFVFMSMLKSHTLTLSHSHFLSLSTCWTTFVFMSRLKSHCL